jgi:N-acetylglucosamine-6-phosphate deacetylase
MRDFVLYNARIIDPGARVLRGYVRVKDGAIVAVAEGAPDDSVAGARIDAQGLLLTPGLVDVHTHGMHTYLYERSVDDLRDAAAALGRYGTTTVVPTIVPSINAACFDTLRALGDALPEIDTAHVPGLHLEGPFVAITGAACETRDGDMALLEELLAATGGRTRVMSIAPEVPGILPVIERLVEHGVTPFITHTRATVAETVAAIDAGARHATHFYDVFPMPEETDPGVRPVGVVETILADPRATCDFIADGIHVDPMAIRAAVAAKGAKGVCLITDASFGAGMPPGVYDTPWGYPVKVKPGNAPRIADAKHPMHGALAGSALTMNRGMRNLLDWIDLPVEQVWAMGTRRPAAVIEAEKKGRIAPGYDADLVLWRDDDLRPTKTWVGGRVVYDEARDPEAVEGSTV